MFQIYNEAKIPDFGLAISMHKMKKDAKRPMKSITFITAKLINSNLAGSASDICFVIDGL